MATLSNTFYELVYGSHSRVSGSHYGPDKVTRRPEYTRELFRKLQISWEIWPRAVVVGSKGKGSTTLFLSSILAASGERVGTVTSPHLLSFSERIRIDGECVSTEELEKAAGIIAPAVRDIEKTIPHPYYLGPHGVILSLAWQIFRSRDVSAVVVEAGRGGEYDEAGCIDPQVTVLTPIMSEHRDKLGDSLQEIAGTKVRISRPGITIVSARQSLPVRQVIQKIANERGCSLKFVHTKIGNDISVSAHGEHQRDNASLAVLAAKELTTYGTTITEQGIHIGLSRVTLHGRLQILQKKPFVVLDGTINSQSARFACNFMKARVKTIIPCVAIPQPKDLDGVLAEVSRISDQVILTRVAKPAHIAWYENAEALARKYFTRIRTIHPSEMAYSTVLKECNDTTGVLLLGTQVFVGNALSYWKMKPCTVW